MNSMQVGSYFIPAKSQAPQAQPKTNGFEKLVQDTLQTLQNQGKKPAKDEKSEEKPLLNPKTEENAKNETVAALPTVEQNASTLLQNLMAQLQTTPAEALLQQLSAAMVPVAAAPEVTAQPAVSQSQPNAIPVVTISVSPAVANALSQSGEVNLPVLQGGEQGAMTQGTMPQAQGSEKADFTQILQNAVDTKQPQGKVMVEQALPLEASTAKATLDKAFAQAVPQTATQVLAEVKNLDTQAQVTQQQATPLGETETKLPTHKAMPTTLGTEDKSGESLNLDMTAGQPKQVFSPDKMHIKVGELSAPEQKAFAADVADSILVKMSENSKEFQVELNPKELGKIHIKLSFIGEQATVILQATNPKTQQLLAANAEGIRAIVEAHAGQETVVVVQEDAAPPQYQEKDHDEGQKQPREQKHEPTKEQSTVDFLNRLRLNLLPQEIS